MSDILKLRVYRYKQGDSAPHYDTYEVEAGPRTTVLDALTAIRSSQDPTLMLRHSCFHASCGTCGMTVNGCEVLACVTNLHDLGTSEVTVAPLRNARVVGDLVVDMADFYSRMTAGRPIVRESELVAGATLAQGIPMALRYEDCIECGVCLAACPEGSDPRFLGPAALAAQGYAASPPRWLDRSYLTRLQERARGEHESAFSCLVCGLCEAVCPSGVHITENVHQLRRWLLKEGH
jgi:succinate dehydrogenase/fumarate reductase iron-sulfur protein